MECIIICKVYDWEILSKLYNGESPLPAKSPPIWARPIALPAPPDLTLDEVLRTDDRLLLALPVPDWRPDTGGRLACKCSRKYIYIAWIYLVFNVFWNIDYVPNNSLKTSVSDIKISTPLVKHNWGKQHVRDAWKAFRQNGS